MESLNKAREMKTTTIEAGTKAMAMIQLRENKFIACSITSPSMYIWMDTGNSHALLSTVRNHACMHVAVAAVLVS
jgi:hypothetical protein